MQKILSPFSTPILWNTLFKNLLIPNNILREVEKNLNLKRNKTFILTFQQNPCKQIKPWKIFFARTGIGVRKGPFAHLLFGKFEEKLENLTKNLVFELLYWKWVTNLSKNCKI